MGWVIPQSLHSWQCQNINFHGNHCEPRGQQGRHRPISISDRCLSQWCQISNHSKQNNCFSNCQETSLSWGIPGIPVYHLWTSTCMVVPCCWLFAESLNPGTWQLLIASKIPYRHSACVLSFNRNTICELNHVEVPETNHFCEWLVFNYWYLKISYIMNRVLTLSGYNHLYSAVHNLGGSYCSNNQQKLNKSTRQRCCPWSTALLYSSCTSNSVTVIMIADDYWTLL